MSEFIDYVFQRSTSLNKIDNSLYSKYNVKNGLRNEDGTGVLVGLTRISDVVGYKKENGKKIDTEGELYYSCLLYTSEFDYIVDAVDTVTAKIKLVEIAQEKKIKIISSMGTGNKLDPTKLEVTDIYKTSICPLARVMLSLIHIFFKRRSRWA